MTSGAPPPAGIPDFAMPEIDIDPVDVEEQRVASGYSANVSARVPMTKMRPALP